MKKDGKLKRVRMKKLQRGEGGVKRFRISTRVQVKEVVRKRSIESGTTEKADKLLKTSIKIDEM